MSAQVCEILLLLPLHNIAALISFCHAGIPDFRTPGRRMLSRSCTHQYSRA